MKKIRTGAKKRVKELLPGITTLLLSALLSLGLTPKGAWGHPHPQENGSSGKLPHTPAPPSPGPHLHSPGAPQTGGTSGKNLWASYTGIKNSKNSFSSDPQHGKHTGHEDGGAKGNTGHSSQGQTGKEQEGQQTSDTGSSESGHSEKSSHSSGGSSKSDPGSTNKSGGITVSQNHPAQGDHPGNSTQPATHSDKNSTPPLPSESKDPAPSSPGSPTGTESNQGTDVSLSVTHADSSNTNPHADFNRDGQETPPNPLSSSGPGTESNTGTPGQTDLGSSTPPPISGSTGETETPPPLSTSGSSPGSGSATPAPSTSGETDTTTTSIVTTTSDDGSGTLTTTTFSPVSNPTPGLITNITRGTTQAPVIDIIIANEQATGSGDENGLSTGFAPTPPPSDFSFEEGNGGSDSSPGDITSTIANSGTSSVVVLIPGLSTRGVEILDSKDERK